MEGGGGEGRKEIQRLIFLILSNKDEAPKTERLVEKTYRQPDRQTDRRDRQRHLQDRQKESEKCHTVRQGAVR